MHCVPTVVLSKQLNSKSAVIRSNRSSCFRNFVCDQTQACTRPNFESRNLWCLLAKSRWNINKSHLRYWLSREKIKNPAFVKNYIFSAEISLGTYTYLYSFESSMKWPFPDIFPSGSTKTSDYKITPNPHVAKKSLQNPDFEAIYHLSVNSYHTLAGGKSIS